MAGEELSSEKKNVIHQMEVMSEHTDNELKKELDEVVDTQNRSS